MIPENKSVKLDFFMQTQELINWCWAAVGTSIALYYEAKSGWTQCKCANASLPVKVPCCPPDPSSTQCNIGFYLVSYPIKGQRIGSLITTGTASPHLPIVDFPFSFEMIQTSIDRNEVLAFNIQTNQKVNVPQQGPTTFSHFIIVSGYQIINGQFYVIVNDAIDQSMANVNENIMTYSTFLTNYDFGTYPSSVKYSYPTNNAVKSPPK